jgi:hypothetical protein
MAEKRIRLGMTPFAHISGRDRPKKPLSQTPRFKKTAQ